MLQTQLQRPQTGLVQRPQTGLVRRREEKLSVKADLTNPYSDAKHGISDGKRWTVARLHIVRKPLVELMNSPDKGPAARI
jgi:hypothetical protein